MMTFIARDYLLQMPAAERETFLEQHLALGYHPDTNDILFMTEEDRYSGTYVMGMPGNGKSGFIETVVSEEARKDAHARRCKIVIDPHGDLVDNILAALPAHLLDHTYVLDALDENFPFGISLFATAKPWAQMNHADRTALIGRTTHVVEVLFGPEVTKQVHLSRYLTNATILLLSNPGSTFYDMLRVFRDTQYVQQLLKNVDDPDVRTFWQHDFLGLGDSKRKQVTDPLMGRLQKIFVGHPITRNVLSQRKSTINFRRAIERGEIILIKLPIKKLRQDAEIIGLVLVAAIHEALFSFADTPADKRPGFSLFIDEFQNFTTKDIEELVTEGRKYKVKLMVAHQFRGQLSDELASAMLATRTKVVFQTTIEDGPKLASLFPPPEPELDPDAVDPHATKYLLEHTPDDPYVRQFVEMYLREMQHYKHGGEVEIQGSYLTLDLSMEKILWGGRRLEAKEFTAPDPTVLLDPLLRDVMRSGNWHLDIPVDAISGLSNGGAGFFAEVRKSQNDSILYGNYRFPYELVRGNEWIAGAPRTHLQQYQHCIFCLRQTMRYLAAHPLGKRKEASSNQVAQWLSSLAKRQAFVRNGQDVGMILTFDTPPLVTGMEWQQRQAAVQAQTRAKYCHSRTAVENALQHSGASPQDDPLSEGPLTQTVAVAAVHNAAQSRPRSRWAEVGEP